MIEKDRLAKIRESERKSHEALYSGEELYKEGSWLKKPIKTVLDLLPLFREYDELKVLDLGCGVGRNAIAVANWPLGWRVAKFGDDDFLQTIIEKHSGEPIGFIIFRNMLHKEEAMELKRIAIMEKGKGYGKEALYLAQKLAFDIFCTEKLYLSTKLSNLRAQAIYKLTGFIPEMPDPCDHFHMNREDYEALKEQK